MKITVNRSSLLKALDTCMNAVEGKVLIDAYRYFLFDVKGNKCHIHGRGSQMEIKMFIPVVSKDTFRFCIPAIKITETVRLLRDEDVVLTTKEKEVEGSNVKSFVTVLTIKGKKNRYSNSGINPDEFPKMIIGEEAKGTDVHMASLVKLLTNSQLAVDAHTLGGALVGVNLSSENNKLKITGARNEFIFRSSIDVSDVDINMTIPKATAAAITALPISPEAKIGTDGKHVIVKSGPVQITAILIDGKYPNTDQFFDKYNKDKFVSVNRMELISTMKILKLYSLKEARDLTITVNAEDITLVGEDDFGSGSAEEVINIDNHGIEEGFRISLNPVYVLSALLNLESDNVRIHLISEKVFIFITEESDEINDTWLIAPVYVAPKK